MFKIFLRTFNYFVLIQHLRKRIEKKKSNKIIRNKIFFKIFYSKFVTKKKRKLVQISNFFMQNINEF